MKPVKLFLQWRAFRRTLEIMPEYKWFITQIYKDDPNYWLKQEEDMEWIKNISKEMAKHSREMISKDILNLLKSEK